MWEYGGSFGDKIPIGKFLKITKPTFLHEKYPNNTVLIENQIVRKFHPKNENPRNKRVPKSTNQSQPDFHDQNVNFDRIKIYIK